jgi:hypothetical protein
MTIGRGVVVEKREMFGGSGSVTARAKARLSQGTELKLEHFLIRRLYQSSPTGHFMQSKLVAYSSPWGQEHRLRRDDVAAVAER